MPTDRRATPFLLTCIALAVLLAACSSGGEPPEEPSKPPSRGPTASSPTATTPSPEEKAVLAVEAAVKKYYGVTNVLLGDPQTPIDGATEVATGAELDALRLLLQQRRADGRRQSGAAVVDSLEVTAVDLSLPARASARVCLDVSSVDVVDRDGTSVVRADRAPRTFINLELVEQATTGYVVERTVAEGSPCEGS